MKTFFASQNPNSNTFLILGFCCDLGFDPGKFLYMFLVFQRSIKGFLVRSLMIISWMDETQHLVLLCVSSLGELSCYRFDSNLWQIDDGYMFIFHIFYKMKPEIFNSLFATLKKMWPNWWWWQESKVFDFLDQVLVSPLQWLNRPFFLSPT